MGEGVATDAGEVPCSLLSLPVVIFSPLCRCCSLFPVVLVCPFGLERLDENLLVSVPRR